MPLPILTGLLTTLAVAAGAASVPIIIHLLNRNRFRVVTWAAMRFLLAAQRKNTRRMRLEQLILLAVRVLMVVLLVLAMASVYPWANGPGGMWSWLFPDTFVRAAAGSHGRIDSPVSADRVEPGAGGPPEIGEDKNGGQHDGLLLGKHRQAEEGQDQDCGAPSGVPRCRGLGAVKEDRVSRGGEEGAERLGASGNIGDGFGLRRVKQEEQGGKGRHPVAVRRG